MSTLENFSKPDAPSNLEKLANTRFSGEKPDIGALDKPLFRQEAPRFPGEGKTGEWRRDEPSPLDRLVDRLEEDFGRITLVDDAVPRNSDAASKKSDAPRDAGDDVEKSLEKLVAEYYDDLKEKSEYPETIHETDGKWEKQAPEVVAEKRQEFNENKEKLINEWEEKNGKEWPRYEEDVYSPSGKLIRQKGDRYDAHHIVPLSQGGKNEAGNITPLHASVHFDKQGVHSPDSPYGKIEQKSQGVQA
jgi:hypothetical protein